MPLDHRKHLPDTATGTRAEAADLALSERLARHRHHPVARVAAGLSQVGDQGPLFGLGAALAGGGWLLGDRRAARAGGRVLLSVLAATAMKGMMKGLVSRTRPHALLDRGHYEVRPLGPGSGPWHSFPSGHTAGSVAAARAVTREYPGGRAPLYAAAGAVGLAQVPTGAHFASDVLAGVLVGLAAEAAVDRGWNAAVTRSDRLGSRAGWFRAPARR